MLSIPTLLNTAATTLVNIFSPSRNPCMKRVAPTRYRHDPYSARVLPQQVEEYQPLYTAAAMMTMEPVAAKMPLQPVVDAASSMNVAAAAAPSPAKKAPATRFAIVQFKHDSMTFLAPFKIAKNDVVVVEGDRGENIGVVAEITTEKPSYAVPNKILRRATVEDREQLAQQREREHAAMRTAQALVNSLGLHCKVEDTELQFDSQKITIFVRRPSKNAFVDFRKLQRGLFREFRCRIWCAYMDEVEAAEAGPRFH